MANRIIGPLCLCALLLSNASIAQAEVIERVVAVVNDEAILLSDLRRRAAPFLEQALAGTKSEIERMGRIETVYKQLMAQLVDEELVEQASRKMQISVSSLEIDQAVDRVRGQNNLTPDQFWQAVRNQGFTQKAYRQDVRKQLLRLKVTNQRVRSRVNITEQTVREEYDTAIRKARRTQQFKAAHIFMELSTTASATEVKETMGQAATLRSKLNAKNFDATMKDAGGGDLGMLQQGDLPAVLEEALLGMEPGQVSQPVRGPSGVHIFLLRERQRGSDTAVGYDEARIQIKQRLLEKAMIRQERIFLTGLRRQAIIETRL